MPASRLQAFALLAPQAPPRWPGEGAALGVVYIALGASVLAYICWNRGVSVVGANAAGIATILAGVLLATRPAGVRPT